MPTPRWTLLSAAAVCLMLGAAGCGGAEVRPAPAPGTSASAGRPGFFGGTDLAWIEINIAMDEELIPLLDLAPTNASSAAIKSYSAQVGALSEGELGALRRLHDRAGLPARNPHKGMPMPGMVTSEQVAAARAVHGAAFDALLVRCVRAHLEQGARLAAGEEKAGGEPQAIALAKQLLDNRTAALKQLDEIHAA